MDRSNLKIDAHLKVNEYLEKNKLSLFIGSLCTDVHHSLVLVSLSRQHVNDNIVVYDIENNTIKSISLNKNASLKRLQNLSTAIVTSKNQYIFSSANGFCIVNSNLDTAGGIQVFERRENPNIKGNTHMEVDKNNNVWFSTEFGVMRYNDEKNSIENYTSFNSNIGDMFFPDLKYSPVTDKLFIGQLSSIDFINSKVLLAEKSNPPKLTSMIISNYKAQGLPVSGEEISLDYKQNTIELEFSNFSFTNSVENKYSYKLSNNWEKFRGLESFERQLSSVKQCR